MPLSFLRLHMEGRFRVGWNLAQEKITDWKPGGVFFSSSLHNFTWMWALKSDQCGAAQAVFVCVVHWVRSRLCARCC